MKAIEEIKQKIKYIKENIKNRGREIKTYKNKLKLDLEELDNQKARIRKRCEENKKRNEREI